MFPVNAPSQTGMGIAAMQCSSSVREDVGEWISINYTQQIVTANVPLSNSILEGLTSTKL